MSPLHHLWPLPTSSSNIATLTERTERENQWDQSKRRPDTCSTCKARAIIKALSSRLCETRHKLAVDGPLEKWWGEGGRGGGKKINANQTAWKKKLCKPKVNKKKYPYRRRVNLKGIKTSNNKARLGLLNVERNYDRMCGTVDPATKNLNFKNLLG